MSTLQIPNHSHCVICQRAVPFGDKTCGPACETKLAELTKKRKRSMYMLYGLMAVAVIVFVLSLGTFHA